MKIIEITKEYFKLEDDTVVFHIEPLDVVPTLEEFQKMYDEAEKFIKGE